MRPYADQKWEQLRMERLLGKGMMGNVYLATLHGEKYVVKIYKAFPVEIREKTGRVWRDLHFYTEVAPKHKELKLWAYDYKIIDNCNDLKIDLREGGVVKFEHPGLHGQFWDRMAPKWQRLHTKLSKCKNCVFMVQPFLNIHCTLGDEIDKMRASIDRGLNPPSRSKRLVFPPLFNQKTYYKWIITLMKQLALLHNIGHTHGDIHYYNAVILAKHKGENEITFIDYSSSSRTGIIDKLMHKDIERLFFFMILKNHDDEFTRLNKIHGDLKCPIGEEEGNKDINKFTREMVIRKKKYDIIIHAVKNVPKYYRNDVAFSLAEMMYPDDIKLLVIPQFASVSVWHELWLIKPEDVLFYLEHAFAPQGLEVVIKHFKRKLHAM